MRLSGTYAIPAFRVDTIDSVAAGDAFCGALAVGLAEGSPMEQAVQFASAAGALATTVAGATTSLPERYEILRLAGQAAV
jgi:ribokinase